MKLIQSFYKTSSLAKNGIFILMATIVILIAGTFLIPEFKGDKTEGQIYNLNGFNLKFDDKAETDKFFQSIISNDGYLCLGTSESTGPANYFDYLNNDPEVDPRFSVLAGAGRTCGVYIPLFKNQGENLSSLKVIYYINPAYWRSNLCDLSQSYWDRYTDYSLAENLDLTDEEIALYGAPSEEYSKTLSPFDKVTRMFESSIRNLRRSYFHDLYYHLNPDKFDEQFLYIPETKNNLASSEIYSNPSFEDYDTTWNMLKSFHNIDWCKSINTKQEFRYNELKSFIAICQELNIEATFIVAPYNERFIRQYDPNSIYEYPKMAEKVKSMLEDSKVNYIDATDISTVAGAFDDHQHHSSYGALLIYEKIKSHLNEK